MFFASVSDMNIGSPWRVAGVGALVVGVGLIVVFFDQTPARRLLSSSGITVTLSEASVTPTPQKAPQGRVVVDGTVAVQTFSGSSLVGGGSALSVSADGLVLTTSKAAPVGSGFVYQVISSSGAIVRARRIASDPTTGLVLLGADSGVGNSVFFDESRTLVAGDALTGVGVFFQFSQVVPFQVPLSVVYSIASRFETVLAMDRSLQPVTVGAAVVDSSGRIVGVLSWSTGTPRLIHAVQVNAFLQRTLEQAKN